MRGRSLSAKYFAKVFCQMLKTILHIVVNSHYVINGWGEFSTSSRLEPMTGKGLRSFIKRGGGGTFLCAHSRRQAHPRRIHKISFEVELNEAFKSLSLITRLLRSVILFLLASSSRCEWRKEIENFANSRKIWLLYVFNY